MKKDLLLYYASSLIWFFISLFFWLKKVDINVYLSTITAILVIHNYHFFIKILKSLLIVTLVLSFYEYISEEYLFVVFRDTFFGFRALDEKFFSGSTGVFRAKVYFEGPLALSQFAIGCAFLFRSNLKILILTLLISVFANGRLGILICSLVLILYLFKKYSIISFLLRPRRFFILISVLTSLTIGLYLVVDQTSVERLKEILNTSNTGNSARIEFWLNGIKTYFNYDFFHLIFGNNGYFVKINKNNAENGWITLLLNNGLLGFTYYFLPLLLAFIKADRNRESYSIALIFLLFFCMFIQTFHLGASANLFYWLIIYSFLKNHD